MTDQYGKNINFPSNLLPLHSTKSASHIEHTREPVQASEVSESEGKIQGCNPSGSPKTQSTLSMSQRQHRIFKNENLRYSIWEPKLCKYFGIVDLKFLKDIDRDKIQQFLDEHKNNTMKQKALRSVLHELKCLYIEQFDIQCITELPEILSRKVKHIILNRMDVNDVSKQRELLNELECTIWKWHKSSNSSYQYLACIATLSLFGFSLEKFCFESVLSVKDLENLSKMLEENVKELKNLTQKQEKEAYVLNIALHNRFETSEVVRFIQSTLYTTIYHIPTSGDADAEF